MSILGNNLLAQYYARQNFGPKANEIWYFAPEQVTLQTTSTTYNSVISHYFADGKGVVTFDKPFIPDVSASRKSTVPALFNGTARNMTRVVLPNGIQQFQNYFCNNCVSLTDINIPPTVEGISVYCFSYCYVLKPIKFPNITYIQQYAFSQCRLLDYTFLPDTIKVLAGFGACPKLALTRLPASLVTLEYGAFDNSPNIEIKRIPATCNSIKGNAFRGCTKITEITFDGTPAEIVDTAFTGCVNLAVIRVPWSEGEVAGAPWGATNATIIYNYQP